MDDPLKINDQIAELKRELARLQTDQQEAQRSGNLDLSNRLQAGIARRTRRLEALQAQRK